MIDEPIIPGFYPDPTICRVGDDYYVANSSFEYSPGVPIWHSSDLMNWVQIGNILTRPSQLTPSAGEANSGIYAPTLRHHDGRFWLITTNVGEVTKGHQIVSADNPAGPWSDAVHTTGAIGIDPDLCWDEDGVCHMTWASAWPQHLQGIASVPIDPTTGAFLAEPRLLWSGTGLAHAEGPHLYRRHGWWYLLLAEGGTERGHTVTIARARTLDGEWEACPHNPILSHRSTDHPVQNTGHADLVELADGSWAIVYLGVRPRGQSPLFHTNGRETFLAGIDWIDGWPVVDEARYTVDPADHSFTDSFEGTELRPRWVSPGNTPERFTQSTASGLLLTAEDTDPAPRILAFRPCDLDWSAEVRIDARGGTARFQVRIDGDHFYGITVTSTMIQPVVRIGPAEATFPETNLAVLSPVTVRITARTPPGALMRPADEPDLVTLSVVRDNLPEHILGTFDGRYLSTEVAGGFTGRVVGVEVLNGSVLISDFTYTTLRKLPTTTRSSTASEPEGRLTTHD